MPSCVMPFAIGAAFGENHNRAALTVRAARR
jgi:hypothetical protein